MFELTCSRQRGAERNKTKHLSRLHWPSLSFVCSQECDVIIAMGEANMSESPVVPMDIHDKDIDAKVFRTSTQARINSASSPLLLGF